MLHTIVEVVEVIDDATHVEEITDILNIRDPVNAA